MTQPPDEPEIVIDGEGAFDSEGTFDGEDAFDHGHASGPGGNPHGRNWLIAAVAAVLLAAIIVIPQLTHGSDDDPTAAPTAIPSTTPTQHSSPSDSAATTTSPTGAGMTTSSPTSPSAAGDSGAVTFYRGGSSPDKAPSPDAAPSPGSGPLSDTAEAPTVTHGDPLALPNSSGWQLVGFHPSRCTGCADPSAVIRYDPATGRTVTTPLPPQGSTGVPLPLSFFTADDTTIIKPYRSAGGYLVSAGHPAERLADGLIGHGPIIPSTQGAAVWVTQATGGEVTRFDLVGLDGTETGVTLRLPPAVSGQSTFAFTSDGAGHILARGTGGTYLLTTHGAHLVTHGEVWAAGPTALMIRQCDEAGECHAFAVDRESGKKHPLPDFAPVPGLLAGALQGVISPDASFAVSLAIGNGPPRFVRTYLTTGHSDDLPGSIESTMMLDAGIGNVVAFTPDSRYVLLNTNRGIVPVDLATGTAHDRLPIDPVAAFAVVSAGLSGD